MAILSSILNLVQCGLAAVLGTGTKGCSPFFKKVNTLWFLPKGFKLDKTRALDETYVKELQADGKLIIVKGIRNFADNTPDDTTEELEDGTKQITRLGLYEFSVNFIQGMYFQAALTSLNSFGNYDVMFWDTEGNGLGTKASDDSLKGFTVGMLQATKKAWATDSVGGREGLMFQLLERQEVDVNYVFIDRASIDFQANTLDGINEVVLSISPTPAAAATTITVVAVTKQDSKPLVGADFSQFLIKTDGATTNPTGGDDSVKGGTYVLTGITALSLNDVVTASLHNNATNKAVIELDTDSYKSNTATATVV